MIIWRDVVGYEGLYKVSSNGEIERVGGFKLSQTNDERGYKKVSLCKNGIPKTIRVHRVVADAFLRKVEGKPHINHIDGNKANNNIKNLEWCTPVENMNHAYDYDLRKNNIKVTLISARSGIRKEFRSMAQASRFLGYSDGYVKELRNKGIIDIGVWYIVYHENE